jgi:hypothetical protein
MTHCLDVKPFLRLLKRYKGKVCSGKFIYTVSKYQSSQQSGERWGAAKGKSTIKYAVTGNYQADEDRLTGLMEAADTCLNYADSQFLPA